MLPTDIDFESKFTFETEANSLPEEPPFHILILGDWSANGVKKDLSERRPIIVDRDNFDEMFARLNVKLELDLNGDGNPISIEFRNLDDFHPDNLFRQVSLFADLREVRQRLFNADSFNEAARQVRAWCNLSEDNPTKGETQELSNNSAPIDSSNLLEQILSSPDKGSSVKPQTADNSELGRFLSKIVSPFLVKIDEDEQVELVAAVDEAISEVMRTILHHPHFQELEAAWRGLYLLVRRVETDIDLKIFIFDVSYQELTDNLKTVKSLAESFIYRWLITETDETSGGDPFAVICGNFSFGVNVDDIATLMRIAKLANAAEVPFISHIYPEMFSLKSFDENTDFSDWRFFDNTTEGKLWTTLRAMPEADSLGLSPMRFLTRATYGNATDVTETFSFEEFTNKIEHENYVWANPGFLCALLLAQSYRLYGWEEMGKHLLRDIEDLPMHFYREDNQTKAKPCAEVILTEDLSEKFLHQGLMPLLSFRDSDRVRLARFQSASLKSKTLKGKWNV